MRLRPDLAYLYLAAVICACAAAVHAACLHGQLVWDDYILISGEAIGGGRSLWSCFTEPFMWHYYRPLVSAWVYLERWLWGWNPVGYHFVGLALASLSVALLIETVRLATRDRTLALLAGALYAVQPVRVPSVAWIGGRTDALVVLFVLGFVLLLLRAGTEASLEAGLIRAAACACFALAVFTKEQAAPLVVLVPLALRWLAGERPAAWRRVLLLSVPFLTVTLLYFLFSARLGVPGLFAPRLGWAEQLRLAGASVWHYVLLLLLPSNTGLLAFSMQGAMRLGAIASAAGYLTLAAAMGLLGYLWRSNRAAAWFLLWAVLTLLPVANFAPLPFLLAAPYRATLPGVAAAVLLAMAALALYRAARGHAALRWAAAFAIAAYLLLNTVVLLRAVPAWRTEHTLFTGMAQADPHGVLGHYMSARVLLNEGRGQAAAWHAERVLDLLFGSGKWQREGEALRLLDRNHRVRMRVMQNQGYIGDPRFFAAQVFGLLGLGRLYANDRPGAEQALRTAYALWNTEQTSCYARGLIALHDRDDRQAEHWLSLAAEGRDARHEAHGALAQLYARQGRHAEADAALKRFRKQFGWANLEGRKD
jgi:hypothetical protein